MRNNILFFFVAIFTMAFPSVASANQEKVTIKSSSELIQLLQQGGLVVYMPHGQVNRNQLLSAKFNDPLNCGTSPSLSKKSQQEMTVVGEVIEQLKLPISAVYSSPFCQTRETAKTVFGDYQIDPKLANSKQRNMSQTNDMGKYLKQAMLTSNTEDGNMVFVGHPTNLIEGFGIWPKPAGVAVVFKKSSDNMILLGMIKPKDWNDFNSAK